MSCFWNLTQIFNVKSAEVKHQSRHSQSSKLLINSKVIEKVTSFCYLGDFIGQHGRYFDVTTARIRFAWKKFRELLPILACRGLSLYHVCVASYCVPLKRVLQHRKMSPVSIAMIWWWKDGCYTKLTDMIPPDELRSWLGLCSIENVLRHTERSSFVRSSSTYGSRHMAKKGGQDNHGSNPRGRPKKDLVGMHKK